jgi:hypothetical protein
MVEYIFLACCVIKERNGFCKTIVLDRHKGEQSKGPQDNCAFKIRA